DRVAGAEPRSDEPGHLVEEKRVALVELDQVCPVARTELVHALTKKMSRAFRPSIPLVRPTAPGAQRLLVGLGRGLRVLAAAVRRVPRRAAARPRVLLRMPRVGVPGLPGGRHAALEEVAGGAAERQHAVPDRVAARLRPLLDRVARATPRVPGVRETPPPTNHAGCQHRGRDHRPGAHTPSVLIFVRPCDRRRACRYYPPETHG